MAYILSHLIDPQGVDRPLGLIFNVLRNCFDHDKAVELIEAAYTPAEIEEIGERRSRRFTFKIEDMQRMLSKEAELAILEWIRATDARNVLRGR